MCDPWDQRANGPEGKLSRDLIWVFHVDGAFNSQGYGIGLILTNSKGVLIEYALQFTFKASNNQAKHEALLANLKIAKELGVKRLKVFIDSKLVVGQA